jgi:hypothetical protein
MGLCIVTRLVYAQPMLMRILGMESLFNCRWGYKLAQESRKGAVNPVYSADSSADYRNWAMDLDEAACWFINPGM